MYMYLAINKSDRNDFHSFYWTEDERLIIQGTEVNPNDWDIVCACVIPVN